jgi:osmotically-inducible protein OsmY
MAMNRRGEVELSGFVGSQADKDRAGSVAATVDGVRKVHNNLVIQ